MKKLVLVGLASLMLAGCSAAGSERVDKAGVPVGPVTLTAWSSENENRPSGMQLTAFAEAVEQLSDGDMTIEATYGGTDEGSNPDQAVITGVQGSDYDIGLVASRAFSSVDVDSFSALTAPFLIQTDAAAAAVARDAQVTGPMLAGLTSAGLAGLAIMPETIRHPFGVHGPILGSAAYQGAGLRSLPSEETYAVFSALGAEPGFWEGDAYAAKVADGSLQIVESSFAIAGGVMGGYATGTGNVAFFPRMNVLFGNQEAFGELSQAQRDVLAQAAGLAQDQTIANQPRDSVAAAGYCANGGRVVLASAEDVAALQAAVAPYLETLAQDPTSRDALAEIRRIVGTTVDPDPVRACEPGSPGETFAPWPITDSASPIDGRYRVEITDADLEAAGVPEAEWLENHGTFTWNISAGQMTYHQQARNPLHNPSEEFYLSLSGEQAMLMSKPEDGSAPTANHVLWISGWSRDDAGTLEFHDYRPALGIAPSDRVLWFAKPFTHLQ